LPSPAAAPQNPPVPAVELVVTDLDGTFWHTDDHLPDAVLDAVAELDRRGIPLLVATGRRLASTRDPLAAFGLAPPAIMLNGAIGIDLRTSERFHLAPYPTEQALAAYDAFVAAGLSPVVYVDHPQWDVFLSHQPDTNPAHVEALGDTAGRHYGPDERTMVDDLRVAVAETPVLGFSMIGVPFSAAEVAVAALEGVVEVHLDRSIDFPGRASLTAAPRGQSKWDGVLAYCARHGIDPGRVLAVADGPNDIELLTNAARRAVPAVAHPSALALATSVIPAAQDGGWAEIIPLLD
jgi:hydroxymethylpyrimidine pyrophosphatase-like HAD family hydrolase